MTHEYYQLAKPGIIYGNLLPAIAAFVFASHDSIDWLAFFMTMLGLAGIIGSACVFNNYLDRDLDALMERTRGRALVSGRVSATNALLYGAGLGVLGGALLLYVSALALTVALVGWLTYVALYTPAKRVTPHALFIGAVAGATPPVVGYVAVTNALDGFALLLFALLFVWQVPHFLSIAVYRYDEYRNARVPSYVPRTPTSSARKTARRVFYASLLVLVGGSIALIVQR